MRPFLFSMSDSNIPIYIGMMSGTSMDGVDAVAATFQKGTYQFIGRSNEPYSKFLKNSLLELCVPGPDELNKLQSRSNEVAKIYAKAFQKLLAQCGLEAADIKAIGAHGQTVRHNPQIGASTQIINGALLAELTETDVITDFRSRDLAAGGEGAPLVPLFHKNVFTSSVARAILNIGGISNITYLPPAGSEESVFGFDCGPGNVLLDAWASEIILTPFDRDGLWARTGQISEELLSKFKAEPYFDLLPPKSTGRELFNIEWLKKRVTDEKPEDVQRTLVRLTAQVFTDALKKFVPEVQEIWICGGGARNKVLLQEIRDLNQNLKVGSTAELGMDPMDVEGAAFAWLAKQFVEKKPGNLPSATGAKGERVLGALYPA